MNHSGNGDADLEHCTWPTGLSIGTDTNQIPDLHTKLIHHMVEHQARRNPTHTAVVFEDHQISYNELNVRANHLAHYLRKLGVGPEFLAGVYITRSIEMVVAMLAILKAGGAYVPLDPSY